LTDYTVWSLRISKEMLELVEMIAEYEHVGRAELVRGWIREKIGWYRKHYKIGAIKAWHKRRQKETEKEKVVSEVAAEEAEEARRRLAAEEAAEK